MELADERTSWRACSLDGRTKSETSVGRSRASIHLIAERGIVVFHVLDMPTLSAPRFPFPLLQSLAIGD